jgi:hypothetical protein
MNRIIYVILLLISVIFVFSSSEEEIATFLIGTPLEAVFTGILSGNTILFNLSMGIVVSSIFYLLVVFLPEQAKRRDIQPHLERHITGVLTRAQRLVSQTIKHSCENYEISSITKKQFKIVCTKVNPKNIITTFTSDNGHFDAHYGVECFNNWSHIELHINEIMHFLPYVDTKIVKVLNEIRNSNLSLGISELKKIDTLRNNNMEVWADNIFDVYVLSENLERLWLKIVNKKFQHPFKK